MKDFEKAFNWGAGIIMGASAPIAVASILIKAISYIGGFR